MTLYILLYCVTLTYFKWWEQNTFYDIIPQKACQNVQEPVRQSCRINFTVSTQAISHNYYYYIRFCFITYIIEYVKLTTCDKLFSWYNKNLQTAIQRKNQACLLIHCFLKKQEHRVVASTLVCFIHQKWACKYLTIQKRGKGWSGLVEWWGVLLVS